MAHVAELRRYPVKGFDAEEVAEARITDAGTLAGDREFALCDPHVVDAENPKYGPDHAYNGKQLPRIHELRTAYDPEPGVLEVTTPDGETRAFDLSRDDEAADEWFESFFDADATLLRTDPPAFVDRPSMGPSVVSTATLEEVASWFDDLTVESARRRMRANVEIDGVPAFWEDRFVGDGAPAFVVGDVRFEGVEPCARCVVPTRDPDTGEPLESFRERFLERREATFPEWADSDAFDHYYTLMLIASVPESDRGGTVRVGDEVDVVDA
jgi:uncharacterized protein YcbX